MAQSQLGKSIAPLRCNPLGPHVYVNEATYHDFPEQWRDAVVDRFNDMLTELDESHSWPIDYEHIRAHTPITTVEWDEDDFEIQEFDVSLDWYSREQLREYETFM